MNIINTPWYFVLPNCCIGSGRSGGVLKGKRKPWMEDHDPPLPAEVAVKRIYRFLEDPFILTEIKNEVEILSSMDHPNIIKCCCVHEDANYFYVCTELVLGGSLLKRLSTKYIFTEAEARSTCSQILNIIEYLHCEKNLVHRDIKPDNILYETTDESSPMKLIDFGFAEFTFSSTDTIPGQEDLDNYALSGVLGTVEYMAPEIWRGDRYGKPVDMWAIGVMTYQILCGDVPFEGITHQDMAENVKIGNVYYDLQQSWNNVSEDGKDFVKKLLDLNPRTRLTVRQAINHPWFAKASNVLASNDLSSALSGLKQFSAKSHFKRLVNATKFAMKLKKAIKKHVTGATPRPAMAPSPLASCSASIHDMAALDLYQGRQMGTLAMNASLDMHRLIRQLSNTPSVMGSYSPAIGFIPGDFIPDAVSPLPESSTPIVRHSPAAMGSGGGLVRQFSAGAVGASSPSNLLTRQTSVVETVDINRIRDGNGNAVCLDILTPRPTAMLLDTGVRPKRIVAPGRYPIAFSSELLSNSSDFESVPEASRIMNLKANERQFSAPAEGTEVTGDLPPLLLPNSCPILLSANPNLHLAPPRSSDALPPLPATRLPTSTRPPSHPSSKQCPVQNGIAAVAALTLDVETFGTAVNPISASDINNHHNSVDRSNDSAAGVVSAAVRQLEETNTTLRNQIQDMLKAIAKYEQIISSNEEVMRLLDPNVNISNVQ